MLRTNLQLLDEKKWGEFSNLLAVPKKIFVSIDGASKEVYEKNRLGGVWEQLQKNLVYLCNLRKDLRAHVDYICLSFIVQDNNFWEMPAFVTMGEELGVDAVEFQKLGNWGTFSESEYKKKDVLDTDNPHYASAVKILQDILKGNCSVEIIQNII